MNQLRNPELIETIYGNVESGFGTCRRTALHIPFIKSSSKVPAQKLDFVYTSETGVRDDDKRHFNAIGSLCTRGARYPLHLPVLDVDGGARLQAVQSGSKLIITTACKGGYQPDSQLRDVLGDHDIDLEVFTEPNEEHTTLRGDYIKGMKVGAIVLRSKSVNAFGVVDSSSRDHSHVYIQSIFDEAAHTTLIDELTKVGVLTEGWRSLVSQEGMGIVRTPWTKKAPDQSGS